MSSKALVEDLNDQAVSPEPQMLPDPATAATQQAARAPVVESRLGHAEKPCGLLDRENRRELASPMRVGEGRGDLGLGQFQVALLAPHCIPSLFRASQSRMRALPRVRALSCMRIH